MKKQAHPRAVVNLLKKAMANPVAVSVTRLDTTSVARKQTIPNMEIGAVLALFEMCAGAHDLQRNTTGRLDNIKKTGYLRNAAEVPTPQSAVQFVFFNGKLEALDGNHRMTLWSRAGEVSMVPSHVDVTIHYPKDEAEYHQVYRCIDSTQSRKTNSDNLYGIFRAIGLAPKSELFLSQKLVSTLKAFSHGKKDDPDSLLAAARSLERELKALDSYGFKSANKFTYSSGVWVGLLALLKENKQDVAEFAEYLLLARCGPRTSLIKTPVAITQFLASYATIASPGVESNIPRVAALLKSAFSDFEQARYPKPRTIRVRKAELRSSKERLAA